MKCNNLLILLSAILLITIIIIYYGRSTFGGTQALNTLETNNYSTNGCSYNDRFFPEGNIPQSWNALTDAERKNLQVNFILDNKYKS